MAAAIPGCNGYAGCALDHMAIRQHVAVNTDEETGAGRNSSIRILGSHITCDHNHCIHIFRIDLTGAQAFAGGNGAAGYGIAGCSRRIGRFFNRLNLLLHSTDLLVEGILHLLALFFPAAVDHGCGHNAAAQNQCQNQYGRQDGFKNGLTVFLRDFLLLGRKLGLYRRCRRLLLGALIAVGLAVLITLIIGMIGLIHRILTVHHIRRIGKRRFLSAHTRIAVGAVFTGGCVHGRFRSIPNRCFLHRCGSRFGMFISLRDIVIFKGIHGIASLYLSEVIIKEICEKSMYISKTFFEFVLKDSSIFPHTCYIIPIFSLCVKGIL